jgi:hypothetical protein
VLTREAAEAISGVLTHMPGGSSHRRMDWEDGHPSSDALGEYLESVARDPSEAGKAAALAAYNAARE